MGERSDKIDFDAFLSCLIRIAQKCYPSCHTKEEAMQQFLMDNILPLAPRRKPISIALLLKQPPIEAIFKYYEDALAELYKFYTTSSDKHRKGKAMLRSTNRSAHSFDDQKEHIEEAKQRSQKENNSANRLGYNDFIRFATDFGLVTTLGITSLDLGDIFLSVTSLSNFTASLRRMSFGEFWEGMVRCALVAFQDKVGLTSETKIKGLFLSIWRHQQSSVQDQMCGYGTMQGGGFNTYKGSLLRGTQLLNDRFVAAWTKDEYRDYLTSLIAPGAGGALTPALPSRTPTKSTKVVPTHSPPPPTTSTLSRLLGGKPDSKGKRSPSPHKDKDIPQPVEVNAVEDSAVTEHRLRNLNHDSIRQSSDFMVKASGGQIVHVLLKEYEEFDDRRLKVADLRELFYSKPHIAQLIADSLYEAGLVDEEPRPAEVAVDEEEEPMFSSSKPFSSVKAAGLFDAVDDEGDEGSQGEEKSAEDELTVEEA